LEKQDELFAKEFEDKELSDDNYPYSLSGKKALVRLRLFLSWTIGLWVFGKIASAILIPLLRVIDVKIAIATKQGGEVINNGLAQTTSMNGNTPHAPINFNFIHFDIINAIEKWVGILFQFTNFIFFILMVAFLIRYIYFIVMRHLNWETYIIRNDFIGMRKKRQYLKQTNIDKLFRELERSISKNKNDKNSERSSKNDMEKQRLLSHKNMEFFVNTRKAQNSSQLQCQIRAVFKVPVLQEATDKVENDLKNIDLALRRLFKGKVTFGKIETSSDFKFLVARGMVAEKKQLEIQEEISRELSEEAVKVKADDSWATFPLSLFYDSTDEYNSKVKSANSFAERMADDLSMYFISVKSNLTYKDYFLNAKNVILNFELPKFNPQMPEESSIEKTLQNKYGQPSITVAISGGVKITIPLPEESQLPLNTVMVLREAFGQAKLQLTDVVFGVLQDGKPLVKNLSKLPHLIIAGGSGSGKSVAVNASIFSLLIHNTPKTLRLILIDPKNVEFSPFEGSPFLFAKIIAGDDKMGNAFAMYSWLANVEMPRRNRLFAQYVGVKNLEDFNSLVNATKRANVIFKKYKIEDYKGFSKSKKEEVKSVGERVAKITLEQPEILTYDTLPMLLVITDEYSYMSDLLDNLGSVAKDMQKKVFDMLGKAARSAGIYLWLATQRPSINVISGDIKANFVSRYALKTASSTDSDVVLDSLGAEKLLGNGDGLFKDANGNLSRTQALFIDDAHDGEFTRILTYMKEHYDEPKYVDYLTERVNSGQVAWAKNEDGTVSDSIVDIVVKKKSIF
jgi:hypothetical protein